MRASSTVTIVDKNTGQVVEVPYQELGAIDGSVVKLPVGPDEVSRFASVDGDLVITLRSGQEVRLSEFFLDQDGAGRNELVLQDSSGVLWWGQYEAPWSEFAFAEVSAVGDLVATGGGGGFGLVALAGLGVAGIAAAASGGGGSGGSGGDDNGGPLPPTPSPDAPLVEQENAAGVGGTAPAGTTIVMRNADGDQVATAATDDDGNWFIPAEDFPDGETEGFEGSVEATDADGNSSEAVDVGPIDGTPPAAPVVEQENAEGVGGTAEPESVITLRNDGSVIATTEADADGNWFIPAEDFPDGETDGFEGTVTATDAAGNESEPADVGPIDGSPPDEPVVEQQNAEGVGGTAEPESVITLRQDGTVVATTETDADGNWFIPAEDFPDGETDGFEGTVTATDAAGNESEPADLGPLRAPDMPQVLQQDLFGIGGESEADAQIELRDQDGNLLAATSADDQGGWFFAADDLPDGVELAGFNGEVAAVNDAGFTSEPAAISIASVWAFDIAGNPAVVIDGVTDSEDLGSLELPGHLLGIGATATDETEPFEVPEGAVGALSFSVSSGSVLTLLDQGFEITLLEQQGDEFVELGTVSNDPGLLGLDLLGLLATNGDWDEEGIPPGTYKLELSRTGGVELLSSGVSVDDLTLNLFDPDQIDNAGVVDVQSFAGNFLTTEGVDGLPAEPGDADTALSVQGEDGSYQVPGPGGLEVQGQFGTLTVQENGDFEYVPAADTAAIGQEDRFGFRLEHPNGETAEAELVLEVGFTAEGAELQQAGQGETVSLQGLEGLEQSDSDQPAEDTDLPELASLLAEDDALLWQGADDGGAPGGVAAASGADLDHGLVVTEDPDSSAFPVV